MTDLFNEEREVLLRVLRPLLSRQWDAPTGCPGWSVKDIAAHILGDDLNNLSGGRDGFTSAWFDGPGWAELVAFINDRNEVWVDALRRLSPQVLIELLGFSGERLQAYFRSLDPMAPGPNVAWAGPGPHPMWLHIAREYTERWLHQAQIREAIHAPMLYERRLFHPVLDTFVHALPVAFATVTAEAGTTVSVETTGDPGGRWWLARTQERWELVEGDESLPAATVRLDQDSARRLWTKALTPEEVQETVVFEADRRLGEPVLRAVAIIA